LLTSLVLSDEEAKLVARSALRCFDWIETLCMVLYPHSSHQLKHHVVEINFEAGDHAMPQDPLEIVLALRAGRAAWEKYPYFDRRFHACAGLTVDSAAELIASAWIDELSGIPGALASTLNWFVDTERFSSEWIANANELATRLNQVGGSTC